MGQLLNNLKTIWNQASLAHRLTLVGIVVAFVGITVPLFYWASRPELALLYGNLAPEDAAKIAEELRDENIDYELKDGGTTIMVPSDEVYKLRLMMVSQGLPAHSNEGYKILDNGELGISPFKERIQYIRAIEGELVRSIKLIDGVHSARVHVVNEERSIFSRDKKEASATVVLKTRGGGTMQRHNVEAITNLVAGAVKGLTADKVVVVVNGNLQAGEERDDIINLSGTLFEQKMKIEKYLSGKAEQQLAIVLGPGRATVKVDATLSTASVQQTKRILDPKQRVEVKTLTEKKDEKGTIAGRGNAKPTGSKKDQKEQIEYDTSSEVVQRTDRPGKIETLTVAVFVDSAALSSPSGGTESSEGAPADTPAKTLTVQQISDAVGKCLGLDSDDSIEVVPAPFAAVEEAEFVEEGPNIMSIALRYTKDFSLGVAVIGMLLVFRMIRGKKIKPQEVQQAASEAAGSVQKKQVTGRQLKGADKQLRQKITAAIQQDPDQVKQLFASWVESGGGE
jgi:flagellar M-ring protein FliF